MGETLLQGFPEAAPAKPIEELIYADVSTLSKTSTFHHPSILFLHNRIRLSL
jgi:hypothetical protein